MESHPLVEEGHTLKKADPCVVVIFGATGDLTSKKLMPALYNLQKEGQLPANFSCVGFARREKSHEDFRKEMHDAVKEHSRTQPIDDTLWNAFQETLYYHISEFDNDEGYESLKKFLSDLDAKHGTEGNRVFYLSIQPSFFPLVIEKLNQHGLIYKVDEKNWSRVIIEKPFGHDLDSAHELQKTLMKHLAESQLYRIDHYLGKETVQNLLTFRFGNSIFESLWNNRYIDHVQITAAEDIGIETRGKFYEESGLFRDIIQNHVMQVMTIVAMEPPVNLDAKSVHDEKVKVLEATRRLSQEEYNTCAVRGQYGKGCVAGEDVKGYREEENVDPNSNIETFGAIKLMVDNWRWDGVPFYLRAAKRLPKRCTEIAITFKHPPNVLFQKMTPDNESNVLAIRVQPDEGIALKINCKVPGPSSPIQPVKMDFKYSSFFGMAPPDAYERLICDCMIGDSTLFARDDEVFHSWEIFSPLLKYWEQNPPQDFPNYEAGSWGPKAADELMERDGRKWRLI